MPVVILINERGTEERRSGGCFGFTGRSGGISNYDRIRRELPQSKIETYRYVFGDQWGSKSQGGLRNPVPYLQWLMEHSSWAKYFKGTNITDSISANSHVDIRCDIPGHCVIGAASAARLASHRADSFIPFFNLCEQLKCNPAIALLVFYAMHLRTTHDVSFTTNGELRRVTTSGGSVRLPSIASGNTLSMGDDEVMDLNNINPGLIYSFIRGDFEMARSDFGTERLYETGCGYQQQILSSFRAERNRESFSDFLLRRFHQPLPQGSVYRTASGGMGGSNASRSIQTPVYLSELVGWVVVLTNEFQTHNKFLGWEQNRGA